MRNDATGDLIRQRYQRDCCFILSNLNFSQGILGPISHPSKALKDFVDRCLINFLFILFYLLHVSMVRLSSASGLLYFIHSFV